MPESDNMQESHPYSKYGLKSPPKGPDPSVSIGPKDAKKKIRKDKLRRLLKDGETKPMVMYLYGRGFMSEESSKERTEKVCAMVAGTTSAREIMSLLISAKGDNDLQQDPTYASLYRTTIATLVAYFKQPGTTGFLSRMGDAKYYLRCQRSGNCYLSAPSIFVSYLAQSRGASLPPLDVTKLVRESFNDSMLYNHVVKEAGGNSVEALEEILIKLGEKKPCLETVSAIVRKHSIDLAEMLEDYGPGLVSGFCCHKNFCQTVTRNEVGWYRFDGDHGAKGEFQKLDGNDYASVATTIDKSDKGISTPEEPSPVDKSKNPTDQECHAMVLIGVRKQGEKVWLLLQNWWTDMQVVEVSLEYFENSDASLTFVTNELSENTHSSDHILNGTCSASPIADCNNLDMMDDPRQTSMFGDLFGMRDGCLPRSVDGCLPRRVEG